MVSSEILLQEMQKILNGKWEIRDGRGLPEIDDIALSKNEAVKLDTTVLYVDMRESTYLVDNHNKSFAAEIYKMFLLSSSKIIQSIGGHITAFDGDRIMAVFIGESKNTNATKSAMQIVYFLKQKINNAIIHNYYQTTYKLDFGIGIDTGTLFAIKTGVRKYNDILWLGNASNYAAKYSELGKSQENIIISKKVYDLLNDSVKYHNQQNMWTWDKPKNIYKTSYFLQF
jgi:class 3 adenylate cyclase